MRGTMEFTVLVVIATLAIVASQQREIYSEKEARHNNCTVLLGGLFPLSENEANKCGKLRTSAVEAVEAMAFTIRRINENSTLLPNVTLTFDIRDTCSIPSKGLQSSLGYVQAPLNGIRDDDVDRLAVSGIIGAGFFSHVSMTVASLFRLFQIPQISYGSSAAELSDRTRFDYFFRTLPSDAFLARAIGDVVNYFNWSYVFALHSEDTFGRSGLEVMLKIFQQNNTFRKCVAELISIPLAAEDEDFDDIVARMNQPWVRNATVAMLYGYRSQATGIMKAIQRLANTDPDTPLQYLTWVGCEALLVDEQYYHLVKGMIRMQYRVNGSYEFQRHFTALNSTNVSGTSNPYLQDYWETKFNCKFASKNCSSFDLGDYAQKSEISSLIDAVYAFAHAIHGLIEQHCSSGTLCSKILVRRSAGMAVNGTMIRDYLLTNLSFPGLSADVVAFDEEGNDQSSYVVYNLQQLPDGESYAFKAVGTWDPQKRIDFTGPIQWNSKNQDIVPQSVCSQQCGNGTFTKFFQGRECCWTCEECLGDNTVSTGEVCEECARGYSPNSDKSQCIKNPVSYLTWSHPWGIVIAIAACLGVIATGTVSVIFVIFRNSTVVKASSRELSAILLAGLILCYILPFFFLARPSVATCTFRRFLVGFSFSICFSALLVKTNRIHRIFNRSSKQTKTQPRFISPSSQIIITTVLISIQVLIALLWLSIEHPDTTYTENADVTELRCAESPTISLFASLGYNLLLLILSTYFAFLARKIPENFNEAKYINVTLYTIIIIWLAFIPVFVATSKLGSLYQTSSLVIGIILSATTTLCCLFAPKVFLLASQASKGKLNKDSIPTTIVFTTVGNDSAAKSSTDLQL